MTDAESGDISHREKLAAFYSVAMYRPALTVGIISMSILAAVLEGVGLSFLIPVIEIAQGTESGDVSAIGLAFISIYQFLNVPFTLETVILGVVVVMTVRYASSFTVAWQSAALRADYIRHLQSEALNHALHVRVGYFDKHGSDEIINAIVTQAEYAGDLIRQVVKIVEQSALSLMYLSIALYLAPWLTLGAGAVLGIFLFGLRSLMESGYSVGDRVADANERVQESVQAGTQGIRDVKLFGLADRVYEDFSAAVDQFVRSLVKLQRNRAIIQNAYELATAITVFFVIYGALRATSLSLAGLGVFLFAMFRLAPRVSNLNNLAYYAAGNLPHLVRTQAFIDELETQQESNGGAELPPAPVERITFENVKFAYGDERILDGVSFSVERGEFVAFVGQSGAGKSTIVSLLSRLYDPDGGRITADGIPVNRFDLEEWRSRLAIVRQSPHVFNDTLRYNVTIGKPDATEAEIMEACEIAQVTEFLEELPDGLETTLGDDGVRLSGGQRQRVALTRALLKDTDFLMLDEATSDLDSNIEETVHRAIEARDRDHGMLVIAHRLSTIINADRIFIVEDGRIVESGTHGELLDKEGIYLELYEAQTYQT